MAWIPGDRLQGGRYIIEKELGKGRFGVTYLVKNQNAERQVIKTLNDDLLQSLSPSECERLETMFWQEAVKLRGCRHKHIVQVMDVFKEGQKSCLVMEYIDGISLADRSQPILSETEAIRYIKQIGEALIVVHGERLIHRDVHPGNILVRVREGQSEAVLIDFGLALEFDSVLTTNRAKQTSEGFTPPELCTKHTKPTGAYSDIYSLAATLYVLLTGKTPVSALQRKIHKIRLVPPIKHNPHISDRTNRAILNGMELATQKRSQSMREWLDLLGLSGESSAKPVTAPLSPARERNWTLVVAFIAAVGTLLSGMAGWIPLFKTPTPQPSSTPSQSTSPLPSKTP